MNESNRVIEVRVRPATREDLPAISAIQAACPEGSQWETSSYLAHDCTVMVVEGVVGGFVVSRETGPGEREILNLAVAPAHRRRGVARGLLAAELSRKQIHWFLEVRESNVAARGFYESLGFREVGRRENYYDGPPEGAIVMRFFS